MAAWRYEISLLVLKNISLVRNYFSTLEEKFRISERPCNILYLFSQHLTFFWKLLVSRYCNDFETTPTEPFDMEKCIVIVGLKLL